MQGVLRHLTGSSKPNPILKSILKSILKLPLKLFLVKLQTRSVLGLMVALLVLEELRRRREASWEAVG